MIKWLHISDLHLKPGDNPDPEQSNLQRALFSSCIKGKIQADFVIITGDFHNFWDIKDYTSAKVFIKKLSNVLNLQLKKDFFFVPGNHDVNQKLSKINRTEIIEKCFIDSEENSIYSMLEKKNCSITDLLEVFRDYSDMTRELLGDCYKTGNVNPEAVHVRNWNDKINILHLNTALVSDGKRNHPEIVDVNSACADNIWENIDLRLPTIVIGHHSFFDLQESHRHQLIQMFNQHNVWAYLAGDQHIANFNDDHDYYINRKQDKEKTWPNILADKLAATTDDEYSKFGVMYYIWDEHSEFMVQPLRWEREDSGIELRECIQDIRHHPMYSYINCSLYFTLMTRLNNIRKNHPSFQLMKIDPLLYPKGFSQLKFSPNGIVKEKQQIKSLSDFFKDSWYSKHKNHLLIEGEGGIGKTVALLSLTSQGDILPHDVPVVYIPLNEVQVEEYKNSIDKYLLEEVLGYNNRDYEELMRLVMKSWKDGPRLVMLLDGFNEVSQDINRKIARDIEIWARKPGIQIIVASRFDVSKYIGLTEASSIKLIELYKYTIEEYLKRIEIPLPPKDSSVWKVINYPLMLTLYAQTETVKKNCNSHLPLEWKSANTAGTIIWNFLQKELYRSWLQTRDPSLYVLITEYITPFISWNMVKSNKFFLEKQELIEYIKQALNKWADISEEERPIHIKSVFEECGELKGLPTYITVYQVLTQNLNIFRECINENSGKEKTSLRLMHQQFRDCFAAIYLLNQTITAKFKKLLPFEWKSPINYYVMNFVSELLKYESSENKTAETLWDINRISSTNVYAIRNMLELQSRLKENDFSQINFSDLDLRNISLHRYHISEKAIIKLPTSMNLLENTKISNQTFTPEGHYDAVKDITIIFGEQQKIISCSKDETIRIWDINTGTTIDIWHEHIAPVNTITISSDSSKCFSGSDDKTIRVWDIDKGECIDVWMGHNASVNTLVISPDGSKCYSGSSDNTIRIWDISKGECIDVWREHNASVNTIVISPDGSKCYSGSSDNTIRVWDINKGECIDVWMGHSASVNTLVISPDGSKCYSGSSDDTIRVWDVDKGKCIVVWKGHNRSIYALSPISSNDSRLFSGAWDCSIRVWDIYSGNCIDVWEGVSVSVNTLALSNDKSLLFSGTDDGFVRVWDINRKICKKVIYKHLKPVFCLAISPDCSKCISGSRDQKICVYDMNSETYKLLEGHTNDIIALAICNDNCTCYSGSRDGTIRRWNLNDNSGICTKIWNISIPIDSMVLSSDETKCYIGLSNGTIKILDITKNIFTSFSGCHLDSVTAIALCKDGSKCFSGSRDQTIKIWDTNTMQCLNTLKGHAGLVQDIKISSDMNKCFSGSFDKTIRIWDIKDINDVHCVNILEQHEAWVNTISLSPDSSTFFSGSDDRTIRIWNLDPSIDNLNFNYINKCTLYPMAGIYLNGLNITKATIVPIEFSTILQENGAVVSKFNKNDDKVVTVKSTSDLSG